ncbi:MAG: ribosome assembly RNA-binding protein YhbY [Aminipila sp.]
MITGKKRSYLRSLAHNIEPMVYIGKSGLTDNIIKELEVNLEARELVKVKIQESCDLDPKEVANNMAESLNAEFVQAIGKKFTLYRESKEHKQIELPKAKR